MIKAVFEISLCLNIIRCQSRTLEPFMIEADFSSIYNFPHSAHLRAYCGNRNFTVCGSSVLNQQILLTAAHCMPRSDCTKGTHIVATFGDENKKKGIRIKASNYKAHSDYSETEISYDIALVLLDKPIALSSMTSRVAITKTPVIDGQVATIAGWGLVDDVEIKRGDLLKHISQKLITRKECRKIIGNLPEGVFCAGDVGSKSYPARGDSGSALVIKNYIQKGILSYNMPYTPSIAVYTDVPYYYIWIHENADKLYCFHQPKKL